MTDETGMLQHAAFNVPRYDDGYCLDDNARALLLMALVEDAGTEDAQAVRALASRYLAFVNHAFNPDRRALPELHVVLPRMDRGVRLGGQPRPRAVGARHRRRPLERSGTAEPRRRSCSTPRCRRSRSSRARAPGPTRCSASTSTCARSRATATSRRCAGRWRERLLDLFRRTSRPDWPWFEDRVTYCNARLSQALLVSGARMEHEEMMAAGLARSRGWPSIQCSADGYFAPDRLQRLLRARRSARPRSTSSRSRRARWSRPVSSAQRVTGDERWAEHARRAFDWFLGQNHLQQSLYDPTTGGCRDGLHADRVNENQGAESTLSFLLALLEMRLAGYPRNAGQLGVGQCTLRD